MSCTARTASQSICLHVRGKGEQHKRTTRRARPRQLSALAAVRGNSQIEPLIKGCSPENRKLVGQVVQQALTAAERWDTTFTNFLTPFELAETLTALDRLADITVIAWGGYEQAERKRLAIGHSDVLLEGYIPDDLVSVTSVRGQFKFDSATHRDFLGAVLGTGIERSRVGDILVDQPAGAHVMLAPALVPHVQAALTQVRSIRVDVKEVDASDVADVIRVPEVQQLSCTEASTRLDAVASAGFRIPRTKCAQVIASGDVKVNWKSVVKGSVTLQEGDVISMAGAGRIEVGEINQTRKGRFAIDIKRYV